MGREGYQSKLSQVREQEIDKKIQSKGSLAWETISSSTRKLKQIMFCVGV
jgi:hypothetical protein